MLPARLMPSDTERASIASRVRALEADLEPATRNQIIDVCAMLFQAFPSQAVDRDTMKARYATWIEALHDLPFWALRKAGQKFIRGEVKGSASFAPSAAEFRRVADAETTAHRAMIIKLNRVLSARPTTVIVHTPEARERVARKAGAFIQSVVESAKREGAV